MAPRIYDANHAFGLSVLQVIATDNAFARLATTLVLKGGAALLHGHHSGRATRRDLDFGLLATLAFDEKIVDDILVRLDAWQPTREVTLNDHAGGITIPIRFSDPATRQNGRIELQVSRRAGTVPPRLKEKIRPIELRTATGSFKFLFMPVEEIAAEKAIRCFNPQKGPREEDLYDLGFIAQLGYDWGEMDWVFARLRQDEGRRFPFPQQGKLIDDVVRALDAPATALRIKRSQLYEEYVSFEQIRERIRVGADLAKALGKV